VQLLVFYFGLKHALAAAKHRLRKNFQLSFLALKPGFQKLHEDVADCCVLHKISGLAHLLLHHVQRLATVPVGHLVTLSHRLICTGLVDIARATELCLVVIANLELATASAELTLLGVVRR
jgi:hypothetical protein